MVGSCDKVSKSMCCSISNEIAEKNYINEELNAKLFIYIKIEVIHA